MKVFFFKKNVEKLLITWRAGTIVCFSNRWEKRVLEKVMFCVERGNVIHISCSVCCFFSMNVVKNVFRMFIFEKSVKKTTFSEVTAKL